MPPKKPSRKEKKQALGSFLDLADDGWVILDRSTIEPWAECPLKAKLLEAKQVSPSAVLNAGIEVHEAISKAIAEWVDSRGHLSQDDLRNALEWNLWGSRPDVQPDVIAAMRPSLWAWAKFLYRTDPTNIEAFDGGEGEKQSQLAIDLEALKVTATSELDLLLRTPSPEVLREIDWKTGYKVHSVDAVYDSFQFQFHADLIFENYPDVQEVQTSVWDTRLGTPPRTVIFRRKDQPKFRNRLLKALEMRALHYAQPPAWPSIDKCPTCEAALLCNVVPPDAAGVLADPVGAVNLLVALDAKSKAIRSVLTSLVDGRGEDVIGDGVAFGRCKPRERRPDAQVYTLPKPRE